MAFRFRLQKVLDYRQKIVDQKSREVGEAGRLVALVQQKIDQVGAQERSATAGAFPAAGPVEIQGLQQRRQWLDHLDRRRKQLGREFDHASSRLAARRAELTEVWRELEVLKKLRDRQQEAWQAEQLRRENQDLDEIGQIRADRQRREKLASGPA